MTRRDAVEKKLVPLKSSFERYADVLRRLGLDVTPRFSSLFGDAGDDILHLNLRTTGLLDSGETILPTRMTICGGYWSLQVARMLAQRKSAS